MRSEHDVRILEHELLTFASSPGWVTCHEGGKHRCKINRDPSLIRMSASEAAGTAPWGLPYPLLSSRAPGLLLEDRDSVGSRDRALRADRNPAAFSQLLFAPAQAAAWRETSRGAASAL